MKRRAKEVLYDSETVLRLVERELQELRNDMTVPAARRQTGASASHGKKRVVNGTRTAKSTGDLSSAATPAKRRRSS